MEDIPRVIYKEGSENYSEDIDEVLDRLIEHDLMNPKYKCTVKHELLINSNCGLILQYLCQLDELRFHFDHQAQMRRKGIGRALESLGSSIHYYGD